MEDFFVHFIIFQILVPTEDANWQDLFNRPEVAEAMKENSRSTYCFRQLHFFADLTVPDVTSNCHMLEVCHCVVTKKVSHSQWRFVY